MIGFYTNFENSKQAAQTRLETLKGMSVEDFRSSAQASELPRLIETVLEDASANIVYERKNIAETLGALVALERASNDIPCERMRSRLKKTISEGTTQLQTIKADFRLN